MGHVKQVFLSTVTGEFKHYRDELRGQLTRPHVSVAMQEDFIAGGGTTLLKLDDYIQHCDAVIHWLGEATGALPEHAAVADLCRRYPDLADRLLVLSETLAAPDPPISYTQWEAYLAIYHRKPLFIAMPAPGAPREPGFVADAEQQIRQQAHRERLRQLERYPEIIFAKREDLGIQLLRSALLEILSPGSTHQPIVLPYPTLGTLFKGRDEMLERLHRQLRQTPAGHATAIVGQAVHGLGGVGKTRLAVEYAWRHSQDYRALLFITADTSPGLAINFAALVGPNALNLPEQAVTEQAVQEAAVRRWLQQHPGWLLILDNVDHPDAAAAVERLLAQLSGGSVLITSRLAQWSGSVQQEPLDVLDTDTAAAFLLERTEPQGTGPGRRRRDSDPADAIELAKELGGLALALEQAGAYIRQQRISLADYRQAWRAHQPAVQTWYNAHLMQYPRSVAVTWQTTIEQFGAGEIALLRLLAWLAPDPIPLFILDGESAAAIWRDAVALARQEIPTRTERDDWRDALVTLADYNLVKWDTQEDTVAVHRVVQEILRSRLAETQRQHGLTLSLRLLNTAVPEMSNDVRNWPRWNPLAPHVAFTVAQADRMGIAEPTARLMNDLGLLLNTKALYAEAEPLYRRALAIREQALGLDHPATATSLNNLALLYHAQGRYGEAEPLYRRALAIREQALGPDHPDTALSLNNLAGLYRTQGRWEAEPLLRRALAIREQALGPDHPDTALGITR